MRNLVKLETVTEDLLSEMRGSINIAAGSLDLGGYNAYVVGIRSEKDPDEGTLIFVPNVSPEELGVKSHLRKL